MKVYFKFFLISGGKKVNTICCYDDTEVGNRYIYIYIYIQYEYMPSNSHTSLPLSPDSFNHGPPATITKYRLLTLVQNLPMLWHVAMVRWTRSMAIHLMYIYIYMIHILIQSTRPLHHCRLLASTVAPATTTKYRLLPLIWHQVS